MSNEILCNCKNDGKNKLTINIIKCFSKHLPISGKDKLNLSTELLSTKKLKLIHYNKNAELNGQQPRANEGDSEYNDLKKATFLGRQDLASAETKVEKKVQTRFLDSLIVDNEKNPLEYNKDDNVKKTVKFKESTEYQEKSPNQSELKLPVLPHRFHGPGCAMEIDILEKHDGKCRFRKKANADRNPTEDRIGSYEAIGRIVFRTCQDSSPDVVLDEIRKKPTYAVFSLLKDIPCVSEGISNIKLREGRSDVLPEIADCIMKKQEMLNNLVRSSKSFTIGERIGNVQCDQCVECSCSGCSCEGFYELGSNYSTVDTSTQTVDTVISSFKYFFKTIITKFIKIIKKLTTKRLFHNFLRFSCNI